MIQNSTGIRDLAPNIRGSVGSTARGVFGKAIEFIAHCPAANL